MPGLFNGSFESWAEAAPDSWTVVAGSCTKVTSGSKHGTNHARVGSPTGYAQSGYTRQTVDATPYRGLTITVRFWCKGYAYSNNDITVAVNGTGGFGSQTSSVQADWSQGELSGLVPTDATTITFTLRAYSGSNYDPVYTYWDAVTLLPLSVYPTVFSAGDATPRVSSIIHRYNRGVYNIEIGFGDVIAESKISNVPDVGGKAYTPHQLDPDKEVGYIPPPSLLPPTPHQLDPDREVGYVPPPSFAPTPHQIDPDREVGPRPPPQPEGNWYLNEFGGWEWFGPGAPTKPPPDNR